MGATHEVEFQGGPGGVLRRQWVHLDEAPLGSPGMPPPALAMHRELSRGGQAYLPGSAARASTPAVAHAGLMVGVAPAPLLPGAVPSGGHAGAPARSTSPLNQVRVKPSNVRLPSGAASPSRSAVGQQGPLTSFPAQFASLGSTHVPPPVPLGAGSMCMVGGAPRIVAAAPPRPLAEGEVISIGSRRFLVGEVIGSGAYAQVWAARLLGKNGEELEEVAIKEMCCGAGPGILPDATVERASFEVQVMIQLAMTFNTSGCRLEEFAAPRVLEHQFWPLYPNSREALLCRVAMERCRGVALVQWLEARVKRGEAALMAASLGNEVDRYCHSFLCSVNAARAMLMQLCPIFERLNGEIALHRDVNARNLLVYAPSDDASSDQVAGGAPADASELEFSVVDFGSSTCVRAWFGGAEGSWQALNPTGDARYWGPASWVRFLGGLQALQKEPNLTRQYSRRLDVYALAICALEVVVKLHVLPPPSEAGCKVHLVQAIRKLRSSWSGYWAQAVGSFERLGEYSRRICSGDQKGADARWQELGRGNIPGSLLHHLHVMCDDLVSLGEVCRMQGGPLASAWGQAGDVVDALREMMHETSALEWAELGRRLGAAPPRARPLVTNRPSGHGQSQLLATMAPTPGAPAPLPLPPPMVTQVIVQERFTGESAPLVQLPPLPLPQAEDEPAAGSMPSTPQPMANAAAATLMSPAMIAPAQAPASMAAALGQMLLRGAVAPGVETMAEEVAYDEAPTTPALASPGTALERWDDHPGFSTPPGPHMRRRFRNGSEDQQRGAQLEAMRILRQVEMEVRNLKGWYSAAISAMKETEKMMATRAPPPDADPLASVDESAV